MTEASLSPSLEQSLLQLLASGKADAALGELERHYPDLRDSPKNLAVLQRWIDLVLRHGLWQRALDLLDECPNYPIAELELMEALCRMNAGDRSAALELFESARAHPEAAPGTQARASFVLLMERGSDQLAAGNPAAALEAYQEASDIRARLPGPYVSMGLCQKGLGDMEAASALAREALKRAPNFAEAYHLLSQCGHAEDALALAEKIEELLENSRPREQDRILLLFAQGRFLKSGGSPQKAFDCFAVANALRAAKHPYDRQNTAREMETLVQSFSKEVLAQTYPGAHDREGLIFIIGMPRSGTTLCEQILAAHPNVFGGGELGSMNMLLAEVSGQFELRGPKWCETLNPGLRTTLAERYLESLHPESGAHLWHTDKMPFNFLSVGLIAHLFPKAKFLLCRRHPYDIALSNMEQHFTGSHPFALALDRTAHFMLGAQRLTRHWHSVLPDRFHTITYEALAEAPEQEIPQLLERLGLPWNENCIAPEKEKRSIETASAWQVRQPIYTTSKNRWQRYSEEQLAPLLEILPAPDGCDDFWPGN